MKWNPRGGLLVSKSFLVISFVVLYELVIATIVLHYWRL